MILTDSPCSAGKKLVSSIPLQPTSHNPKPSRMLAGSQAWKVLSDIRPGLDFSFTTCKEAERIIEHHVQISKNPWISSVAFPWKALKNLMTTLARIPKQITLKTFSLLFCMLRYHPNCTPESLGSLRGFSTTKLKQWGCQNMTFRGWAIPGLGGLGDPSNQTNASFRLKMLTRRNGLP